MAPRVLSALGGPEAEQKSYQSSLHLLSPLAIDAASSDPRGSGWLLQRLRSGKILRMGSCFQPPLQECSKKLRLVMGKGIEQKFPFPLLRKVVVTSLFYFQN